MNRTRWILAVPILGLASCIASPVPTGAPAGTARPNVKTAAARTPHEMVTIIDDVGKVEADLTSMELVITRTARDGSLVLKLFKDFVRVPVATYVYHDPVRCSIEGLNLYVVSISNDHGFAMAAFQLVKGKLHVVRLD
jgi:hypothetical protein